MSSSVPSVVARALALVGVLAAGAAHAATLLETSVEQMLFGSELVVEGEVVAVDRSARAASAAGGASRYPWTAVTIAVSDIVKGSAAALDARGQLTLHFIGGERDGVRVEVPGMRIPGVGTRAIFFVESVAGGQPNPLFGWQQGELHIKTDARGASRTYTSAGIPVHEVGRGALRGRLVTASGAAAGVSMTSDVRGAMSPAAVKQRLRSLLAEGAKGEIGR